MFNRSEIMREAWKLVRRGNRDRFPLRFLLRNALRTIWGRVKHNALMAARPATSATEARVYMIECKDTPLTRAEIEEIRRLRAA